MSGFDRDSTPKEDCSRDEAAKEGASIDAQRARSEHLRRRNYILGIASSGLFVALIVASAFLSIPIGPIKFTLQFMVTNMCCLLLGKKWGTLSILLYILLGLFGLPIFSNGGGFAYVLQPSFGFMIGFVVGGFFAALFRERVANNNFATYLFASLIDMAIMDIIGVVYGAIIMYGYMRSAMALWDFFMVMLIPFIPIDIVKCVICSLLCPRLKRYVKLA